MTNPQQTSVKHLGGLSLFELVRRTIRGSWQDEVFGQAGRMAFYHFLALFPAVLVFLAITAHIPHLGDHMKNAIQDMSRQVLPNQVSQLFQSLVEELSQHARSHVPLLPVLAGAAWAGLNATWALIYGLNTAYEVQESRTKPRLALTLIGLALSLAATGSLALLLILFGRTLHHDLRTAAVPLRILGWIVLAAALLLSFSVLYRFAPNIPNARWRWSTPGALCALLLWVVGTIGARIYFGHYNDYSRSYGHLNSAVMLLLWLYISNGAVLIGGEMNSEIEKASAESAKPMQGNDHRNQQPAISRQLN
jgi:membrane protein